MKPINRVFIIKKIIQVQVITMHRRFSNETCRAKDNRQTLVSIVITVHTSSLDISNHSLKQRGQGLPTVPLGSNLSHLSDKRALPTRAIIDKKNPHFFSHGCFIVTRREERWENKEQKERRIRKTSGWIPGSWCDEEIDSTSSLGTMSRKNEFERRAYF